MRVASQKSIPHLAFSPITKMPYLPSFVFPIDERSEELWSSHRNELSISSTKIEEGRQQLPVIKVLEQSNANVTGNCQILVIDDEKAEEVDSEAQKIDQEEMVTRQAASNPWELQKAK